MDTSKQASLVERARADAAETRLLAKTYNESTGLTWLWSMLFGPLYFWVHGFIGRGFLLLALCLPTFGLAVLVAPFLAYAGWSKRARLKAEDLVTISNARSAR